MQDLDLSTLPGLRVWNDVDVNKFRDEIMPLGEPAVLKGLVSDWPIVAKGMESPESLAGYIRQMGPDERVLSFYADENIKGRYFYSDDLKGFNFDRREVGLGELIDKLMSDLNNERAPCIHAGGIALNGRLSKLIDENPNPLIDDSKKQLPAMWIGNRGRTAAHWDIAQNIACVVGGRRQFTLVPPDQTANLYVGPLDFTIAGQPLSLVDFHKPDYDRFPRFKEALAAARSATLGPGDAIYIPSMWYHHVESLDQFGVLVNFWWREAQPYMVTPFLTMFHAILSIRDLPKSEKEAWRNMFDHYIFQLDGDPAEHMPEDARGFLGKLTPERVSGLKNYLIKMLGGTPPSDNST